MVKIDIKGFKSVELQRGSLTIRGGGHLNKAMQLITKDVMATGRGQGSVAATYVHIRSREPWLSQAVPAWCEYHAGSPAVADEALSDNPSHRNKTADQPLPERLRQEVSIVAHG